MKRTIRFFLTVAFALCGGCLCLPLCVGCQFSGSTALPPLPGLQVTTPSGYEILADSNLKGSLEFQDGDGKIIKVKLTQDVEGVVNAQASLAQGLEGLAKIETERQKAMWNSLGIMFQTLIDRALPIPEPLPGPMEGTP